MGRKRSSSIVQGIMSSIMKGRAMDTQELRSHYNLIRSRLLNPPNPVFDTGIDLKRHRIPTPNPLKVEEKIEFIQETVIEYQPQEPPKPIKFAAILRAVRSQARALHDGGGASLVMGCSDGTHHHPAVVVVLVLVVAAARAGLGRY